MGPDKSINLFETTIRVVGGLLSAHHLSGGDPKLLAKAADLAARARRPANPRILEPVNPPTSQPVNPPTRQSDNLPTRRHLYQLLL